MIEIRDRRDRRTLLQVDAGTLMGADLSGAELDERDLPTVAAVSRACLEQDGGFPNAATEEFVAAQYATGDDSRAWGIYVKGELVASAGVRPAPPGREYGVTVVGQVHPTYRRWGLGRFLLIWSEQRARELLAAAPDRPRVLSLTNELFTEDAHRLYTRNGWAQQMVEEVMRRDLRTPLPEPELPAEVGLHAWSEEFAPAFFQVYEASFRERPGFLGWDAPTWTAWATGDDDFRPEWSLLATSGEEPVGFIVCADGWIVQAGVRPEWRARGIGAGLVVEALRRMEACGAGEVFLDVNTNNPGAARLYTRLGFRVIGRRARYTRTLAD